MVDRGAAKSGSTLPLRVPLDEVHDSRPPRHVATTMEGLCDIFGLQQFRLPPSVIPLKVVATAISRLRIPYSEGQHSHRGEERALKRPSVPATDHSSVESRREITSPSVLLGPWDHPDLAGPSKFFCGFVGLDSGRRLQAFEETAWECAICSRCAQRLALPLLALVRCWLGSRQRGTFPFAVCPRWPKCNCDPSIIYTHTLKPVGQSRGMQPRAWRSCTCLQHALMARIRQHSF